VPAFTDSELGLDVALQIQRAKREGKAPIRYDGFLDLEDLKDRLLRAERGGIFTIGGGVPRNWAQQIGPYLEITKKRLGLDVPRAPEALRLALAPLRGARRGGAPAARGLRSRSPPRSADRAVTSREDEPCPLRGSRRRRARRGTRAPS